MANTSTTTLKSCTMRPQSSISRLVDQLKQSSLNEHDSSNFMPLLAGCADQFHRMQLEQSRQSQSQQQQQTTIQSEHNTSLTFETGSTIKSKAVPITERKGQSREDHSRAVHFTDVFTASSSACSSDSNRAVSEPEDENDPSQWQPDPSIENDACCYQLLSTSAPTSHSIQCSRPLLAQIDSTKCKGFCCSQHHPYPQSGQSIPICPNLTVPLGPGDDDLHSSPNPYPYHSQAKRACRSLSASSAVQHLVNSNQPSTNGSMTAAATATNTLSSVNSKSNTIKELETHINTLPRPIAIRLDSKNCEKPLYLSSVDSTRGYINGVPLRPKPTEPMYGSRLSWHHPLFTTGSGCKAHPPNYVSRSNTNPSDSVTVPGSSKHNHSQCNNHHASRRTNMLSCWRHSGNWSAVGQSNCAAHGSNQFMLPCCSETDHTASGSIPINLLQSPSSAFTSTRNSLIQYEMGIHSSGCSLSPDADSTFSSVQIPARTPSSGFHEASFSGLSETSSLPDCSKFGVNHPTDQPTGFHPNKDKPDVSKISNDIFFSDGLNLDFQKCGLSSTVQNSSSLTDPLYLTVSSSCATTTTTATSASNTSSSPASVKSAATSESAIRCRSQPSAATEFPSSESNGAPVPCDSSTCTVGLKRRRGPSGDNNNNIDTSDSDRSKPSSLFYTSANDTLESTAFTSNPQIGFNLDFSGISPRLQPHPHYRYHKHNLHAPNHFYHHHHQHRHHSHQHPLSSCACKTTTLPSPSSVPNANTPISSLSAYSPGHHHHHHGSNSMLLNGPTNFGIPDTSKNIFVFGSNSMSSLPNISPSHHHHHHHCHHSHNVNQSIMPSSLNCSLCPDEPPSDSSSLLIESNKSKVTVDSEDSSTMIESDHSWHQSINPDLKHIRTNFDYDTFTPYRHVCNELSELSEAMEEEKEYETPETITEDTGSHSNQVVTSPSIQEVTFAPIRQCSEVWTDNPNDETEEIPIGRPHHHSHRSMRISKELVDPLGRPNDLFVSLSSSNSDSSDSESILSPQMPDRQLQCNSHLVGSTDSTDLGQTVSFTDLDLDLIENN